MTTKRATFTMGDRSGNVRDINGRAAIRAARGEG